MNTAQTAQIALRQARKSGLTLRVERPTTGDAILHVSGPKGRLKQMPWLTAAITLAKADLIALLEAEGHGTCTGADGTRWHQTLARCEKCGVSDWGVVGHDTDRWGQSMDVHGCLTCRAQEAELRQSLEQAVQPQEAPHA